MRFSFSVLALATTLIASSAAAEGEYLTFRGGVFDADDVFETGQIGIEYRGKAIWKDLHCMGGIEGNFDGGVYVYGGVNWEIDLNDEWMVMPSLAVGAYEDGDSRDLGGPINFRSGVEVNYRMENDHRVGLSLNHISNAGIYDDNPGTETLMINYTIPFGGFGK